MIYAFYPYSNTVEESRESLWVGVRNNDDDFLRK